jgi:hypothetical protein
MLCPQYVCVAEVTGYCAHWIRILARRYHQKGPQACADQRQQQTRLVKKPIREALFLNIISTDTSYFLLENFAILRYVMAHYYRLHAYLLICFMYFCQEGWIMSIHS